MRPAAAGLHAAGEPLGLTQEQVQFRGHAVECRINAEDPRRFTPSPGEVRKYHPPGGLGVRMDSHIYAGYTVPPNYDSMIGKLITYGPSRADAIARMRNALSELVVEGIQSNVPLQRRIMEDPTFQDGRHDIHYLETLIQQWVDE